MSRHLLYSFFFNDTATTEIYTLSLHDALPIYLLIGGPGDVDDVRRELPADLRDRVTLLGLLPGADLPRLYRSDRKSTRLNSSHANIVCGLLLEKKKKHQLQ